MGKINKKILENGICYALAHSINLIEDATVLYFDWRISSSFLFAVMAREELGRANLLSRRCDAMTETETIEFETIKDELRDHRGRLDAGQSTTTFQLPAELIAEMTVAWENNDREILDSIHKKKKKISDKKRKSDPDRLHLRRFKAQYVDLNSDGSWSLPSDFEKTEAFELLFIVANEISDTLLWAESDKDMIEICTRTHQILPTFAEFQAKVITRLLCGNANK
jgi:AbiV family abortive infection protein